MKYQVLTSSQPPLTGSIMLRIALTTRLEPATTTTVIGRVSLLSRCRNLAAAERSGSI